MKRQNVSQEKIGRKTKQINKFPRGNETVKMLLQKDEEGSLFKTFEVLKMEERVLYETRDY